ncbi:unnamed protein product (mitochondrion) [Plasmodiophora brassicae]|uniref:No apical meristem-associated C-terminal domain-containing protein n=1 Tax=Plasmodiophora brassicae TaxID=37360 RepID=A0A0G4IHR1_PLABS|nr:hypothetical protein PBRA_000397 [Plasmodiophora brassicae]SPQ93124.1 unnamed protein product [Plasmodiophora brassicae]
MERGGDRQDGEAKRSQRGTNFTDAEDVLLARSWLNVSQDPATGTGQSKDTFWERVEAHFCSNTSAGERSARSLQSKWSTIQREVSKFVGSIFASVKALDESGTNEDEQIEKALTLFKSTNAKNSSFSYLHCWRVLRTVPKWQDLRGRQAEGTPKVKRKLDPNGDVVEVDNSPSTSVASERPIGVKAAKTQKKLAVEQSSIQASMAASMAAKAAAAQLQTQMSLFTMDLSCLDP